MKRRGPALQKNRLSRLFRTRHIRFIDPETNLVHRAKRDRILQPGSRLLVPKFALGQDIQRLSEKTLKSEPLGLPSGCIANFGDVSNSFNLFSDCRKKRSIEFFYHQLETREQGNVKAYRDVN